ncbi:hypothetical protein O9929_12640 [Vibrio lentus]|nr:hypothetical protein [Vibrio lentus]
MFRYSGFVRAMESAGLSVEHDLVTWGDGPAEKYVLSFVNSVSNTYEFTAIFACVDTIRYLAPSSHRKIRYHIKRCSLASAMILPVISTAYHCSVTF